MARYRRFDTARVATVTVPEAIEGVRVRRAGLRSAMSALEPRWRRPRRGASTNGGRA